MCSTKTSNVQMKNKKKCNKKNFLNLPNIYPNNIKKVSLTINLNSIRDHLRPVSSLLRFIRQA